MFDEVDHLVSIRSSEDCVDSDFFKKSYITKFSGIPINCKKCKQNLLYHHSYHLEYHDNCRFCKQSWHKHKAKTEQEFHDLVKEEDSYFRRVCPFCINNSFTLIMQRDMLKMNIRKQHLNVVTVKKCSNQSKQRHTTRLPIIQVQIFLHISVKYERKNLAQKQI